MHRKLHIVKLSVESLLICALVMGGYWIACQSRSLKWQRQAETRMRSRAPQWLGRGREYVWEMDYGEEGKS